MNSEALLPSCPRSLLIFSRSRRKGWGEDFALIRPMVLWPSVSLRQGHIEKQDRETEAVAFGGLAFSMAIVPSL